MALDLEMSPDELKIFMEEGEEQLEVLAQGLLALERSAGDVDLLQRIFRAAHTLKGSSGAVGHRRMADLTHAMESVLDLVRSGKMQVTTELIDLLLRGSDALAVLLAEVTAPDGEPELDERSSPPRSASMRRRRRRPRPARRRPQGEAQARPLEGEADKEGARSARRATGLADARAGRRRRLRHPRDHRSG